MGVVERTDPEFRVKVHLAVGVERSAFSLTGWVKKALDG